MTTDHSNHVFCDANLGCIVAAEPKFDKAKWERDNRSERNKTRDRTQYKHDNGKWVSDRKYLSKRFIAVDGEGVNVRKGPRKGEHDYIMLAVSGVDPIVNPDGLRTLDVLNYLWSNLSNDDINVIYGGSYDFNCWLKDLTVDELAYVYRSGWGRKALNYRGYEIRWIKGKGFEIARDGRLVTINDVISFFQRPFIAACDEYLGSDWEGRNVIVREKARRGNFTVEEVSEVGYYNSLELDRLVDLCTELRARLNRVTLRPRRWNSPGAIAAALFHREGVKAHMDDDVPEAVARAARFAYAGGRFEMIQYGVSKDPAYEYDLNSAYPRALLEVPSLANGKWMHRKSDPGDLHFALYRVRFTGTDVNAPAPVFVRGEKGTIAYPLHAENWIWSPEMEVLREYCAQTGDTYEVYEAWEFVEDDPSVRPFGFIRKLYDKRKALKAVGDGAHVGIKLALNSCYGKLAQQVGWRKATAKHPLRKPAYHQLEWAGYVTSWCRSRVLRAALTDLDAVIAFETDALFTSRPLNIPISDDLGGWEETVFKSLSYVQSGHYYGTVVKEGSKEIPGGKEIIKCRGVDKGSITRRSVERVVLTEPTERRILQAKLTRFFGAGIALSRGVAQYWRKWLTEPKSLQLQPSGKRMHGACYCDPSAPLTKGWHRTFCPAMGGVSSEYPVEWINPNPNMSELAELRESEYDYEQDN
ncbi:DNA primase/polymerase [Microbacterium phage Bee17]|nr:DNA primase/polymerase [Microbacterium phage Bee17]